MGVIASRNSNAADVRIACMTCLPRTVVHLRCRGKRCNMKLLHLTFVLLPIWRSRLDGDGPLSELCPTGTGIAANYADIQLGTNRVPRLRSHSRNLRNSRL